MWHENAKKFGWGSSAALPLHCNNKVVGVFTLYSKTTNAFDKAAKKLLDEMATDISYALEGFELEKKRIEMENAISDSNTLLKSIIDNSPVRIFWKDKDLNYLGCNRIFAQDAGEADPQNIIGKNDTHLCWHKQAKQYMEDDRKVIESGIAQLFFEESQTTPNGDTIWLSTSKIPLYNKNQEIIGILGLYEDITTRKNSEMALKREKETAQNLVSISSRLINLL